MAKVNVTGIVLGTLGTAVGEVGKMLADNKVTVGEIWSTTMGIGHAIVAAIPGAAGVRVYKVAGNVKTVADLMTAIDMTVSTGLEEFGVAPVVVGKV